MLGKLIITTVVTVWLTVVGFGQIVVNGDFEGPASVSGNDQIPAGWTAFETFSGSLSEVSVISVSPGNGGNVAEFDRSNGGTSGDWTCLEQELTYCAGAATQLTLSLDVRIDCHDLEGGGDFDFEWPVTVVLFYEDTNGNARTWQWGFYIDPPGTGTDTSPRETLVVIGTWSSHSFNLLTELVNPARLDKIRVGGSGWNFHGKVDNVSISAVEPPSPFPGTGEDLRLLHSVGGGPFVCDPIIPVNGNDLVILKAESRLGTYDGVEMYILGDTFVTGNDPTSIFPGIVTGPNTFLVAGGPVPGIGSPLAMPPGGYYIAYVWPPSATGFSFLTQALVATPQANNFIFASSNGQELQGQ